MSRRSKRSRSAAALGLALTGLTVGQAALGQTPSPLVPKFGASPAFTGWDPIHSGAGFPQDYDITGLDVTLLLTKPTGGVVDSSGKMYIVNSSDHRPQVVQRSNGYRGYVCDISGSSTYMWRWESPTNIQDRPHNDPNKPANAQGQPYPSPQLYAMGYLYPFASAQRVVASGGTDSQFALDYTGKGDVLDNWYAT